MKDEILSDFDVPWCQALSQSSEYIHYEQPKIRHPPPPADKATSNRAFDSLLKTESTVRAIMYLVGKQVKEPNLSREWIGLHSLGADLAGHDGILHGGFFGFLIDGVAGMCATDFAGSTVMTVESGIKFVKFIRVPSVIACRAAVVKREGRRITVRSTLEDSEGRICAQAVMIFYTRKSAAPSNL